jgi:hypothetical protein
MNDERSENIAQKEKAICKIGFGTKELHKSKQIFNGLKINEFL